MASPAAAITSRLLGSPAITSLVGQKVYPVLSRMLDSATLPLIVYKIADVTTTQTFGGSDPLTSCKVEFEIDAMTYADADAIAFALIATLDCQTGVWGGVTIQGCFLDEDGVTDEFANESESEQFNYYIKTATFTLWFVNSVTVAPPLPPSPQSLSSLSRYNVVETNPETKRPRTAN